jgi:hypothetical protein
MVSTNKDSYWLSWSHHFESVTGRHQYLVNLDGIYVSQMTPDRFHLSNALPCSFLIQPLSRITLYMLEPQDLGYHIPVMHTLYAGAVRTLLLIKKKFTMWNFKSSLLLCFAPNRTSFMVAIKLLNQRFLLEVEGITSEVLLMPSWLCQPLRNNIVIDKH